MSGQPDTAPEEGIIETILKDGESQARRVVDNARRSEHSEQHKAEAEAAEIRKEIVGKAEAKARTLKSKVIATGHIEAKRMVLRAREEAILKVFDTMDQELQKIRGNPAEYRQALTNLAVEAISAVGGSGVVLKIGQADQNLTDDSLLAEISRRAGEQTGREIAITLEIDPALTGGGCVAVSGEGRIIFDNTFARRLERMKPALRSVIVREVLKTDD
ncbi:MAG: V-type ATP synthase subunit E family protein [Candidatus Eisenbacteria bacterium]